MSADKKAKKDTWDKAAIVSSFVSSVMIAGAALTINASIQDAQIANSKQIADGQKRVQEGTLTGQLVEHLASDNPIKRRLAIIALQSAVPLEMYQHVVGVVVRLDPSADVRIAAYEQVATLRNPGEEIAKSIAAAAQDLTKQQVERETAKSVSDKLEGVQITNLRPEAALLAQKLLHNAREKGIVLRVIAGYRSLEDQDKLVRQNRSRAQVSSHNTGLAFDIGIFENGRFLDGVTQHELAQYKIVGELGKELGLVWGGDGKVFRDLPHFETKDAQEVAAKLRQNLNQN